MVNQLTPIEDEKYLQSISFPASKDDLIKQARNNQAPEQVLNILGKFGDSKYSSVTDVAKEAEK